MSAERVPNSLRRFTTIGSVIDTLRNARLAFVDPDRWDDKNDAEFIRLYKKERNCPNLKALCCTESRETYHHWRVFTNSSDGCLIELCKEPLLKSMKKDDSYFYAEMEYVTLEKMKDSKYEVSDLPFLKRAGFEPELEFRVIYTGKCGIDTHFMPIQLSWVKRIVLNPWLPKPISDSIIATLREISGISDLKVTTSRLTNSQTWTKYGKTIVERGG